MPGITAAAAAAATFQAADLRCEYLPNPIGIDEAHPRLSWIDESATRGWFQSAYQIHAASTPELLASGKPDLWDSGKVESDASGQIVYSGRALVSREAAYWSVRVWSHSGQVSVWSKPARFEMGLLDEAAWQGSAWIGKNGSAPPPPPAAPNPAPYLRRDFEVGKGKVARARLYACGLAYAEMHLNGAKVGGDRERDPGYTAFNKRALYTTYDVTAQLHTGPNTLGAILGTGWYDVHDIATWHFENAPWRGRPRLRAVLAIDYADGRHEFVTSDPAWKLTTEGPLLSDGIYTGDKYDARREMPGWDATGFDASRWSPVDILPAPTTHLSALRCPPVAITKTVTPVAIAQPQPGVYVVDLGQNLTGHAQIRLHNAPAGATITLRYSEQVGGDGMIRRQSIDHFMEKTEPPQPFQTDTYIARGAASEVWEQRFSYSGFRYVEVTGFPGTPTIGNFRGRFAHTAVESAGDFACSNDLLNKIQSATRWSYLSNAQSIPTDCPQREKNGWTGDAQLAAEAGLMNFDSATFYTKWLDDLADNQHANGRLGMIVPTGGWGDGSINPPWDSALPIVAWELYRYCGDIRILERHYDGIRRYVDMLAATAHDGVTPGFALGDWLPWSKTAPNELCATAYLYYDAHILAQAARLTGKPGDAAQYEALANAVRDGFNRKFFDAAQNTYSNGTQTALALPLYFGMVPADHQAAVFATLAADVDHKGHIDTGILGAKYVLRVLSENGRTDLAYRIVATTEQPGWGWWFTRGATTLWEDWKGEDSLNHIMFGDVSNWFYQWIAGIGLDPNAPAFEHIVIQPQPVGGLTWARATHHSARGTIESAWKIADGNFELTLTLPANTTATVELPGLDAQKVTEGGKPVSRSIGVHYRRTSGDRCVFEVQSGAYAFTSPLPKRH